MAETNETTSPQVHVFICIRARCPVCGKQVERQKTLTEESLTTGNTTQRASYCAEQLRMVVKHETEDRGWTAEMCGGCRDKAPAEREKEVQHKRQLDEIKRIARSPFEAP